MDLISALPKSNGSELDEDIEVGCLRMVTRRHCLIFEEALDQIARPVRILAKADWSEIMPSADTPQTKIDANDPQGTHNQFIQN
jgi:hypothetical protein